MSRQNYHLQRPVYFLGYGSIVGPLEGKGPLGPYFPRVLDDDRFGMETYEQAECLMLQEAITMAMADGCVLLKDVDFMVAGDLLNQIISANYAARQLKIPLLGIYGACSGMAESLLIGAMTLSGGYGDRCVCATASHFSTAERQYRQPLEMGVQRPPYAQRTVTGAGASLIGIQGVREPRITDVCIGRVVDLGISDPNHMGAAMAPAAADTLGCIFSHSGFSPSDFDRIITGDLGKVGSALLLELLHAQGWDIASLHYDCGTEIFKGVKDTDAGGSGCGCSASVLNGVLLPAIQRGEFRRILFAATGALLSPTSQLQKESIPGICHGIIIEGDKTC